MRRQRGEAGLVRAVLEDAPAEGLCLAVVEAAGKTGDFLREAEEARFQQEQLVAAEDDWRVASGEVLVAGDAAVGKGRLLKPGHQEVRHSARHLLQAHQVRPDLAVGAEQALHPAFRRAVRPDRLPLRAVAVAFPLVVRKDHHKRFKTVVLCPGVRHCA